MKATSLPLEKRFVRLILRADIKLKNRNKKQMSKYTKALNNVKPGKVYDLLEKEISKAEYDYDEFDEDYYDKFDEDYDEFDDEFDEDYNENNKSKKKVFKSLTSKIGPILKKLHEGVRDEGGKRDGGRPSGVAEMLKRQAQQAGQQVAPGSQKMQRSLTQANVGNNLTQPLIDTTFLGQPEVIDDDCPCPSCPCPFGGRKKKTKRRKRRKKKNKNRKTRRKTKRKTRKRRGGMRRGNYTQRSPVPRQVKKAFRNR